jgi:8-oxo-dGTP pyrophosphatase MutT (NUDIX family)
MAYARNNRGRKKNKSLFCTNCGKTGHEWRDCSVPTTSWGIILVNISSEIQLNHDISDVPVNIYSSLNEYSPYESRVKVENNDIDRTLCSTILDCISFLMISRKHSLAYVEFVRGRYKAEKPIQVAYLFKLMSPIEIDRIRKSLEMKNGFEHLWNDMWGKKADIPALDRNRRDAKSKYDMLKHIGVDGPEIGLDFMVNKVTAKFNIDEWGFPKGRRLQNESEKNCAIREFMEESGYEREDFKIIDGIEPIIEEFFGTDGAKYRHVYYVAELLTKKIPKSDLTESQQDEVGDITFMNLSTATQTIRPYHVEKINLSTALTQYYFDTVYLAVKDLISSRERTINTDIEITDDSTNSSNNNSNDNSNDNLEPQSVSRPK